MVGPNLLTIIGVILVSIGIYLLIDYYLEVRFLAGLLGFMYFFIGFAANFIGIPVYGAQGINYLMIGIGLIIGIISIIVYTAFSRKRVDENEYALVLLGLAMLFSVGFVTMGLFGIPEVDDPHEGWGFLDAGSWFDVEAISSTSGHLVFDCGAPVGLLPHHDFQERSRCPGVPKTRFCATSRHARRWHGVRRLRGPQSNGLDGTGRSSSALRR